MEQGTRVPFNKRIVGLHRQSYSSSVRLGDFAGRLQSGFVVAAAVENEHSGTPFILAIPESATGLCRSEDLQLLGLQSSNTAALDFFNVKVGSDWQLHEDAHVFLPAVRPAFLGLQCGMAIGLARRALQEAEAHSQHQRSILLEPLLNQRWQLEGRVGELKRG